MAMFGNLPRSLASGGMGLVEGDQPPIVPADVTPRKFGVWDAVGVLGDALQSFGGGQATYTPMLAAERQRQQMLQQQQVKRRNDWEDFVREYEHKRKNPMPTAPTEFERALIGAGIDPRSPQGVSLYAQRATTMASPQPQFISDGLGGGTWVTPPAPTASLAPQALGSELPAGWAIDDPVKPKINTSIPSGNPLEPWSPR